MARGKPKKVYCHHEWTWVTHNDFKDGEYWFCNKCGKIKWGQN